MSEPSAPEAPARGPSTSEASTSTCVQRLTVVYIMGAGHSGSTILGVALGNCHDLFYAGELEEWLLRSGVPLFGGTERTRFWNEVRKQAGDASDLFGARVRETLERSGSAFRPSSRRNRGSLRARYLQVAEELYRAVASVAGARRIVDTSHYPLRAHELQRLDGIDLYLLFLVRDPQNVIGSYIAPINRHASVERTLRILSKNLDLWLTNALSIFVFLRHRRDRRLFLRYEDFIADPQGVLRQILDLLGSTAALPDLSELRTGYPLMGNPLLWSEVVALKSKPVTAARTSRITTLLQLPLPALLARLRPAASSRPAAGISEPVAR